MRDGLIIDAAGNKFWYKAGLLHNENGPALEFTDGYKAWWINGKWHRLDGPAIEDTDGNKIWYYEDQYIECESQEEFEYIIKLKILW